MLLATCAYCGDSASSRCATCAEDYCSRKCQRAAWPTHKRVCTPLEAAVEQAYKRGRDAMMRESGPETHGSAGAACWICCEDAGVLLRGGCACRGDATVGHVACFVEAAKADDAKPVRDTMWMRCSVCLQRWTGVMSFELLVALWRHKPETWVALKAAGAALGAVGETGVATRLFRKCLINMRKVLSEDDARVYDVLENLGNVMSLDETTLEKAIDVHRRCWLWRRDRGPTKNDVDSAASNLAHSLLKASSRLAKAGAASADVVALSEEAERVLASSAPDVGRASDMDAVHRALLYAEVLARNDRLDRAGALLDDLVAKLRRLLGADHNHYGYAANMREAVRLCQAQSGRHRGDPDAWLRVRLALLHRAGTCV